MGQTFEWENRTRLVQDVADSLRERIYSGEFVPGDHLRQLQISATLKVSRTPVREAFRVLEQEGLVTKSSDGSVQVIEVDAAELLDAYAMREVVDGLAARVASQRFEKESMDHLLHLIELQRQSISPWVPHEYTSLNVRFHANILELAGNKFLSRELPLVRMTSQVFTPSSMLDRDRAAKAIEEHTEIVAAIGSGNGEVAEKAARLHIRTTLMHLEKIN